MGATPQPHSQARLSSTGRETNRQTRFTQPQPLKTTLTRFLCLLPPATDSFPAPWLRILDPLTSGFYSTDPLKWTQIQEAHSAVKTALVLELRTHCHHARSPHKLPPTQDSAGSTLTCSHMV